MASMVVTTPPRDRSASLSAAVPPKLFACALFSLELGLSAGALVMAAEPVPTTTHQGSWQEAAPAPTPRSEVGAATLDGMLYLVGGFEAAGSQDLTPIVVSRAVEAFDPVWNGWSAKAPLPQPLHHAGVVVVDRQLYVVGGFTRVGVSQWTPVATLYRYNPVSDTWTERQPMPTPRGALAVAVVDQKLYAIGGWDGQHNLTSVEIYDPATDRWTAGGSLPSGRDHLSAAVLGHDIYLFGGRLHRDPAHNLTLVERYDVATHRWESRASLPTARSGGAAATVGDRIYLFGGESPTETIREVDVYVPATNRWFSAGTMPTARHGLGAAVYQDRVYLMAGGPQPGGTFSAVNDVFVPPAPGDSAPRARASNQQVGAVMAVLATWAEAGILPPESTPDASRIVKALIQFQGAMMKSTNRHVVEFFEAAFAERFGATAESQLKQARREGWTSRNLEAVLEYATGPAHWDEQRLEQGWREFNVGTQDLRLLASLNHAAKAELAADGKDLHHLYEEKRKLMPGAR